MGWNIWLYIVWSVRVSERPTMDQRDSRWWFNEGECGTKWIKWPPLHYLPMHAHLSSDCCHLTHEVHTNGPLYSLYRAIFLSLEMEFWLCHLTHTQKCLCHLCCMGNKLLVLSMSWLSRLIKAEIDPIIVSNRHCYPYEFAWRRQPGM